MSVETTRAHYFELYHRCNHTDKMRARYVRIDEKGEIQRNNGFPIDFSLDHEKNILEMLEKEKEKGFLFWGGSKEWDLYLNMISSNGKTIIIKNK